MIRGVWDVARDVRIAIDLNCTDAPLLLDDDETTLALNDVIAKRIVDAVRMVESSAPLELIDAESSFDDSNVVWDTATTGHVVLPSDFMRLLAFKMSDWERAVYEAAESGSKTLEMQYSRYGVKGNVERPVVGFEKRKEGQSLAFFACKANTADIDIALYRALPKLDEYGGIEISTRCYEPVVFMTAALALSAVGEIDLSNRMKGIAESYYKKQ